MDKILINDHLQESMPVFIFRHALNTVNKECRQIFQCHANGEGIVISANERCSDKNTILLGSLLESLHIAAIQRGYIMSSKLIFENRHEGFVVADVFFFPCPFKINTHSSPVSSSELSIQIKQKLSNRFKKLFLVRQIKNIFRLLGIQSEPTSLAFSMESTTNQVETLVLQNTLCKMGELAYRKGLLLKASGYAVHTLSVEAVSVEDSFAISMGVENNPEELASYRQRELRGITSYVDTLAIITFKQNMF